MNPRTTGAALALASLMVLAGCTGGLASGPGSGADAAVQQSAGDGGTTIVVAGEGSVEAEPDAATVRLAVVETGEDPETVRNRLSRNVSAVREALLEYGLSEDQVRSEHFRIDENHRARREGATDEPPYIGIHQLVVETDDPDAVGEIIDAAVESGPVRVEGVHFGLSEQRREQLRDEALEEAVENARGEAELVAAAEGLSVTSVDRMATDRVRVDEPRATVLEAAATATPGGDGASTQVQSGEVTVTASVQVVYNATDGQSSNGNSGS